MPSQNTFRNCIEKLITEFEEKGFNPDVGRIKQWYEYMKDIPDDEFVKRIDWVLKNVSRKPSMADIFQAKINEDK